MDLGGGGAIPRGNPLTLKSWKELRLGFTIILSTHSTTRQLNTASFFEVFERSRSKSLPLEKTRSKLANPVELSWGFDRGC